eukprot:gene14885-biopygen6624
MWGNHVYAPFARAPLPPSAAPPAAAHRGGPLRPVAQNTHRHSQSARLGGTASESDHATTRGCPGDCATTTERCAGPAADTRTRRRAPRAAPRWPRTCSGAAPETRGGGAGNLWDLAVPSTIPGVPRIPGRPDSRALGSCRRWAGATAPVPRWKDLHTDISNEVLVHIWRAAGHGRPVTPGGGQAPKRRLPAQSAARRRPAPGLRAGRA